MAKLTLHKMMWAVWCGCLLTVAGCERSKSSVPPLVLTLQADDDRPLGGSMYRRLGNEMFRHRPQRSNTLPFQEWYRSGVSGSRRQAGRLFVSVTPALQAFADEAEAMAAYVRAGNTLMVAADYFSEDFCRQFNIRLGGNRNAMFTLLGMRETHHSLADSTIFGGRDYSFFFHPAQRYIVTDSLQHFQVISRNERMQPDGIRMPYGNGSLVVVTNVSGFTNYFLLTRPNHQWLLGIGGYLPAEPREVIWDDFYRRHPVRQPPDKGLLATMLSIPALRNALLLLAILSLLWIITQIVRRQRAIPVVVPPHNTTVEFTDTIARLYFNRRDNLSIASKMVHHFLDDIRSRHYLPPMPLDDDFARMLSGKTNLPLSDAYSLVSMMRQVQTGMQVSDDTLTELNRLMESAIEHVKSPSVQAIGGD